MTALAQEFGISDRGLAKICSRHRIPVPPRGYWAKVAAGERPKVPPLLELKDGTLDPVSIVGATASLPDSVAELARKRKIERQDRVPAISQAADCPLETIKNPHRTVAKTAKFLRTKKPDKEGVLSAIGPGLCGVIISVSSVERSIFILNALAHGLEVVGLSLAAEGNKMSVHKASEQLSFTLLERTKRVKYIPTPEEVAREEQQKKKLPRSRHEKELDSLLFRHQRPWPEYVTERTGQLFFSIDTWADGLRTTWSDGKKQRVERMVPDIVMGIELVLEALRVRREEREESERQRQILQHRMQLARAREKREEKRCSKLQHIMVLRREARDIRDWLASLPENTKASDETDLGRMLLWVNERLAKIDRQTGIEGARLFAGTGDLFPQIDELHDPLGDPPANSGWGY